MKQRSLFLLATLLVVLAACGAEPAAESSTTSTGAATPSTDSTTAAPATVAPGSTTSTSTSTSTSTQATTSTTAPTTTTSAATTTTGIDEPKTVDIDIANFRFSPSETKIKVGDTVRWTVVSGTHTTTSSDGVWDSKTLAADGVFSFTFPEAGDYPYFCAIHPGMQATITVEP